MTAFLNVEQAAAFLGVSKSCAYAAIEDGSFPVPVVKIGSRIKIPAGPLYALAGTDSDSSACESDRPAVTLVGPRGTSRAGR